MSITDGLRKVFDNCTVTAGVEDKFECIYITKAAALKLLDEIDEAFAEGHARAVEYGKASVTGESRWHELFGTPERAARTLQGGTLICRECLIRDQCAETPEDSNCMILHHDELLEWLRGDA